MNIYLFEGMDKNSQYTKSPSGINEKLTTLNFGTDKFENFQVMINNRYKDKKIDLLYGSAYCFGTIHAGINNYAHEIISGEISAEKAISLIKTQLKTH